MHGEPVLHFNTTSFLAIFCLAQNFEKIKALTDVEFVDLIRKVQLKKNYKKVIKML